MNALDPIERAAGADGHTHEHGCLNCGTPLTGAYCHACGQHAHVHRTLGARINDQEGELRLLETMHDRGFVKGTSTRLSDDVPGWIREPMQHAADNPDLALYKLKSSAYKWSWALIPLSVTFLWLLFPSSRRFRPYDHTVFVTYSLSFVSLLVVAVTIGSALGIKGVALALLLIPPVHMYRQLKGTYGLSRSGALVRTVALASFSVVVLLLFVVVMLAVGLLD